MLLISNKFQNPIFAVLVREQAFSLQMHYQKSATRFEFMPFSFKTVFKWNYVFLFIIFSFFISVKGKFLTYNLFIATDLAEKGLRPYVTSKALDPP